MRRKRGFRDIHHTKAGEVVAATWHGAWAVLSLAQGVLSVSYAWFAWGITRFMDSPAAQSLFFLCISTAIFGIGGAVYHLIAALAHGKAARGAK